MAIKNQKIVADFETITDPQDVRVWAVCAVDIDTLKTVHIGNSLDDFMEWLSRKNTVCYFHNLKFDSAFILDWLLKNGYTCAKTKTEKTFETLITDTGVFYSITVYFKKENKKYRKVVFYDSLKKLPFKVSVISKAFELEDEKLSIDYDAPRPVGHELTQEEKDYIVNDCRIVAQALQIQMAQGLTKMTNASDAMNWYKGIIRKDNFQWTFPVFPIELDAQIRRAYKGGFVYVQPEYRGAEGLQGITLDTNSLYPFTMHECLLPYGFPKFFEGEPGEDEIYPLYIVNIDCCFELKEGHIPTIQLKNNRAFIETEYLTSSNDEIVNMTLTNVDLQLLRDHYEIHYIKFYDGWRFKGAHGLFKDYIDHWMRIKETTTGAKRQLAKLMLNSLYGKFATNPRALKKLPYLDETGTVRFAQPALYPPYVDQNGVVHDKLPEDKTLYLGRGKQVVYETEKDEMRDPVYTAMGAFITAYARENTIRSAQTVYDRFIYADTDSLHLIGWDIPEGLEVHPTHLGAWKNEGRWCRSKFIRAKTYMESMVVRKSSSLENYCKLMQTGATVYREKKEITVPDSLRNYCCLLNHGMEIWRLPDENEIYFQDTKVTCAGMPDNVKEQVTYENFHSDSTFEGKLMPKRYPGGIVLEPTTFTIK